MVHKTFFLQITNILMLNIFIMHHNPFLLSLNYKKKKYCLGVKFLKRTLWWIYMFWGVLYPKITFLAFCLRVRVCVSVISITQKQITAESSNLAFCICIKCRCYLQNILYRSNKNSVHRGTRKNSNTILPLDWIFVSEF